MRHALALKETYIPTHISKTHQMRFTHFIPTLINLAKKNFRDHEGSFVTKIPTTITVSEGNQLLVTVIVMFYH